MNDSHGVPGSRRSRRRGFTLVEIFIASLILLVVLMVAYTFMTQSTKQSNKARLLSEAVQAGAMMLHALHNDLSNAIPQKEPESAVQRSYDPASRQWKLSFGRRTEALDFFLELDGWEDPSNKSVEYIAEPVDPNAKTLIYRIFRKFPADDPDPQVTYFAGAHAEAVRFETFNAGDATSSYTIPFLRVNLLLVGIPAEKIGGKNYDPNDVVAADRPKPYLLTFLARIPMNQPR